MLNQLACLNLACLDSSGIDDRSDQPSDQPSDGCFDEPSDIRRIGQ